MILKIKVSNYLRKFHYFVGVDYAVYGGLLSLLKFNIISIREKFCRAHQDCSICKIELDPLLAARNINE